MSINDPDKPDSRMIGELVARYQESARRLREIVIDPNGKTPRSQQFNQARAASLLAQVEDEIAKLKKQTADWTGNSLQNAMRKGLRAADEQAERAGIRPVTVPQEGSFDLLDRRTVETFARDIVGDLNQATDSMFNQAGQALRRMAATGVTNAEVNAILTGGVITGYPDRAVRELRDALKKVHGEKITITDKNGNPMEFQAGYYAKMVAVTKSRQATREARHARLKDRGLDLVVIIGKQSANFCTAYMDKVFSISGEHPDYPPLSSLPGGGPPFHPNCSKGTAPFVEALRDPVEIEVGQPDDSTNAMLNDEDRTALQRKYQSLQMKRQVEARAKRLRTDAGRKVITSENDDPKYQEYLLKQWGIEEVSLDGNAKIGANVVRGIQQCVSAGLPMPKGIMVSDRLFIEGDKVDTSTPAFWQGDRIAINPAWPGWKDTAHRKRNFESEYWSTDSPYHIIVHEAAHHDHLIRSDRPRQADFSPSQFDIAGKVSAYAQKSPDEFVAEVMVGKIAGRKFDDDVMEQYRRLGGR